MRDRISWFAFSWLLKEFKDDKTLDLFLGGWHGPWLPPAWGGIVWFVAKVAVLQVAFLFVRRAPAARLPVAAESEAARGL